MSGLDLICRFQTDAIFPCCLLSPFPHSLGSKLESFSSCKFLGLDTSAHVPRHFKKKQFCSPVEHRLLYKHWGPNFSTKIPIKEAS